MATEKPIFREKDSWRSDPVTPDQRKYVSIICHKLGIEAPLEGQFKSKGAASDFINQNKGLMTRSKVKPNSIRYRK